MNKLNSLNWKEKFYSSAIAHKTVSGSYGSDISASCCIDTTEV